MMPDELDFYSASPTVEGKLKLLHDRLRHPADVKVTGDALRKLELLQQVAEAAKSLVQFLDEDSIHDQVSDLRLLIAKEETEDRLISAVARLAREESK